MLLRVNPFLVYAILSRLAYVVVVGWTLRREERARYSTTRLGSAEAFRQAAGRTGLKTVIEVNG